MNGLFFNIFKVVNDNDAGLAVPGCPK